MRIGVTFPQTEISADPGLISEYAQAAESLRYSHLLAYDHVLGASTEKRPDWKGAYTEKQQFHEPLVLFGFLAGITRRIELVTGVLVLPQRQTALVAKQAAEVDRLSNGRLRLGVGIGWNAVEYEALGKPFADRASRIGEQIELLRRLWSKPVIDFAGRWERVDDAGINPLPAQRSIPIWIGAFAESGVRRAARIADGWFPLLRPDEKGRESIDRFRGYVQEYGRDPAAVGIEGSIRYAVGEDAWPQRVREWADAGATHISINTMGAGLAKPVDHIRAIERFAAVIEL